MKIYTKFGDAGKTQLIGGVVTTKCDSRIEAIGELDELNSSIGLVRSHLPCSSESSEFERLDTSLARIQNELFQWGAVLAGAKSSKQNVPDAETVSKLESEIDTWQAELPRMTHFILPGGSAIGATLHLARAISRRAERRITSLANSLEETAAQDTDESGEKSLGRLQQYLNRLSDWLFVAARAANKTAGRPEAKWVPKPHTE